MKRNPKLIDVFGDVMTDGGIFTKLNLLDVPWSNDVDAVTLDLDYFYNTSGQKNVSPLVRRFLNGADTITDAQKVSLANVIYKMYIKNWNKEYAVLGLEYNPISNYDSSESESIERENSNNRANTGTQSTSGNQTVSSKTSGSGENNIYGFNSATAVGDSTSSDSATNTTTSTDSNTRTDNLSESQTGEETVTRTLTRSGNIGVTTSQQMAQSEIDLWKWKFFYDIVFPDLDEILTTMTYSR